MDTELQQEIRSSLDILISKYLKKNVFSACSIGIVDEINGKFTKAVFNYGNSGGVVMAPVDDNTVFDLASLTKPLVVTLCILALVEKCKLRLNSRVCDYVDLRGKGTDVIQIQHLLEHTSGLPAHKEYFKELITLPEGEKQKTLLSLIGQENLLTMPGEKELYSDLGYILLGQIVVKVSGKNINNFWRETVIAPLGLEKELFFAEKEKLSERVYPATGSCEWTNKELSGLVNDDNCRSIGGVSGHAGLFGTSTGLISLIKILFKIYRSGYEHPFFSLDLIKKRMQAQHGRWVLGFDTPTGPVSSSGKYFSEKTLGHLGFTGTSFWMDCKQGCGVVLLTNRVLYGEDLTGIQEFRPAVHDLIMERLTGDKNE